jgi:hypothetical protein
MCAILPVHPHAHSVPLLFPAAVVASENKVYYESKSMQAGEDAARG